MRVTLLTIGTRGDVQPFVALGKGLQSAGHSVTLATHASFGSWINSMGLGFSPLAGDPRQFLDSEEGKQLLDGKNGLEYVARGLKTLSALFEALFIDSLEACMGTEAIIYSAASMAGPHIAESLGVPCFATWFHPITPTSAFPSPVLDQVKLGSFSNKMTYIFLEQLIWQFLKRPINRLRESKLGLAQVPLLGPYVQQRKQKLPYLYCYSPSVVPKAPDWPNWIHVTGYWFLEDQPQWEAPCELAGFLDAGEAPIYIGFGSMKVAQPEALTDMIVEALKRLNRRAVVQAGWGGLLRNRLPDHIFPVESVPHDWLFSKVCAAVHHGGAGTTMTALKAGISSVITPFFGDQFYWGQRISDLGCGPEPISQRNLSTTALTNAMDRAINDPKLQMRTVELGKRVAEEDGVTNAVKLFHEHLS
jgi:sterol 3beta-glucosyltransferase